MGIETLKSNFKAIQKTERIASNHKIRLATTLLYEIAYLFFEDPTYGTTGEKESAQLLYHKIKRYITTLSSV